VSAPEVSTTSSSFIYQFNKYFFSGYKERFRSIGGIFPKFKLPGVEKASYCDPSPLNSHCPVLQGWVCSPSQLFVILFPYSIED